MAIIGGHTIYKIDDTDIIPIAHENNKTKIGNPDEAKWVNSIVWNSKVDKNGMKVCLLDVFKSAGIISHEIMVSSNLIGWTGNQSSCCIQWFHGEYLENF